MQHYCNDTPYSIGSPLITLLSWVILTMVDNLCAEEQATWFDTKFAIDAEIRQACSRPNNLR
jgi:hypothetical protein